ncbi:MAG: acyl-CoA dehydrogenase family protein [Chlamydiales bacterium]|nr:acyl-CoA dehydrogenase family protein [Chlamydiia bacterium]MCP5508681.1 acyl-CoA dehydrogenase family protein [Chlamydiales bacterium]
MDKEQQQLAEELLFSEEKKPSFAKRLFFGDYPSHQVFPYPLVDKEEKRRTDEYLKELEDFLNNEFDAASIDRNAEIPQSVIHGLAKRGVLGMSVPKEYGGLGMSQHAYCRAVEMIARRCSATAIFVNAHQSIGLKGILLFGTDEQKDKWLPPLSKGEKIAAFSLTEPNAGSDASGVETRAVYDPERKVYRLNGRKQWTTNGSIAEVLTVMAQTEMDTPEGKKDKITAFIVTPDMPGFRITDKALEKVGVRGTRTTNIEFNDVEVPEAYILGEKGAGLKICLTTLDYGRTTFGAMCTGAAKYALECTLNHAVTRYQFKQPLCAFPLVKKKLATMAAQVYAMDATTYMTAGLIDSGVEDIMLEAAILKVFCSEALWSIIFEAMQIHGGRSFFTDMPLERMMRDARLNTIGEGSNEVLRAFIGLVGMRDVGMQLKDIVDALHSPLTKLGKLFSFGRGRMRWPHVAVRSEKIKVEAEELARQVKRFGDEVQHALYIHREAIIDKQLVLDRIASCVIAIYTMTAVLSKIDSEIEQCNGRLNDDVAANLETAKLYCIIANNQIDQNIVKLHDNDDSRYEELSDKLVKYYE